MPTISTCLPATGEARSSRSSPGVAERRVGSRFNAGPPSVGAGAVRDGVDGADENLQVQRHRPVVDVAQVEPQGLLPGEIAAPAHLPEPGQARAKAKPPVCGAVVAGNL